MSGARASVRIAVLLTGVSLPSLALAIEVAPVEFVRVTPLGGSGGGARAARPAPAPIARPVPAVTRRAAAAAGAQGPRVRTRGASVVARRRAAPEAVNPPAAAEPPVQQPQNTINPVSGADLPLDKVPSAVGRVSAAQIQTRGAVNIQEALSQYVPSVVLSNQNGSPFQQDLQYRGFTASPVSGTPQGLAVYQNGVRINEAFGDIVNWDFIPTIAIRDIDVVSNNPVFGLNALGGAISIQMKDGFSYQGFESDIRGGSFGRIQGNIQYGKQVGNYSSYFAFEGLGEDGFRDFSSAQVFRGYGDIGYRGDRAEVHLNFTGAKNFINANGTTPVQLVARDRDSVYTTPQSSDNQLAFFNLQGTAQATDTISIQSNLYFRHYEQVHIDGNTTDAAPCDNTPGFLCFMNDNAGTENVATNTRGQPIRDRSNGGTNNITLGETDSTFTTTNSEGGTVQVTDTQKILGHDNHLIAGFSYDHGDTSFLATSELGAIQRNLALTGFGEFFDTPTLNGVVGVQPASIHATNDYLGAFATDTFDVTNRLSVTANVRYNLAYIDLLDRAGGKATGNNEYNRINPGVGATFKITPDITVFGGYSEANRAPTPLELGCADPNNPCILQNFLVSDPPLKQVVAQSIEAGVRGKYNLPNEVGQIKWSASAFRTDSSNDILQIPNTTNGFGYFANVGNTRREGAEASINFRNDTLSAYATYSLVNATFQSSILLGSPNNPRADANGNIHVRPGDQLPAIPMHRLKLGFDYVITPKWKVGADLNLVSSQFYVGDESNLNNKLPGYGVVNARTSYQITPNVQVYAMVDNLFDRHYATYGTYFATGGIPFLNLSNPRATNVSAPVAAYGGLHVKF